MAKFNNELFRNYFLTNFNYIRSKLFLNIEFIILDAISQKDNECIKSEESVSELIELEDRKSLAESLKTNNFNGTSNILKTKYSNFDIEGKNLREISKNAPVNIRTVSTDNNRRSFRILDEKKSACLKTQNSTIKTLATHIKESEVIELIFYIFLM